jgi:hypothetical protein
MLLTPQGWSVVALDGGALDGGAIDGGALGAELTLDDAVGRWAVQLEITSTKDAIKTARRTLRWPLTGAATRGVAARGCGAGTT